MDDLPPYTAFGATLRHARLDAGISQRELARAAGISCSYVAQVESGFLRPPAEPTIRRICAALHQDPAWWIRLAGKIPEEMRTAVLRASPEALELMRMIADLSFDEVLAVKRWIRNQ